MNPRLLFLPQCKVPRMHSELLLDHLGPCKMHSARDQHGSNIKFVPQINVCSISADNAEL